MSQYSTVSHGDGQASVYLIHGDILPARCVAETESSKQTGMLKLAIKSCHLGSRYSLVHQAHQAMPRHLQAGIGGSNPPGPNCLSGRFSLGLRVMTFHSGSILERTTCTPDHRDTAAVHSRSGGDSNQESIGACHRWSAQGYHRQDLEPSYFWPYRMRRSSLPVWPVPFSITSLY